MAFRIFLFLTFFLIFSCRNDHDDNKKYISKEKMVKILIDIHLVEEKVNQLNYSNDSSKAVFNILEKEIFDKYNITDEEYRKSYSHYFFNPKELDDIYKSVIDSLNVYNQSFN